MRWFLSATTKFAVYPPARQNVTVSKIRSFAEYAAGWNFGEGEVFSPRTVDKAIGVVKLYNQIGISATDAFPGSDGEIKVTAYKDKFYIQYTVSERGSAVRILNGERVVFNERNLSDADAGKAVSGVLGEIWSISDSLTSRRITINVGDASTHLRSSARWDPESRFYAESA